LFSCAGADTRQAAEEVIVRENLPLVGYLVSELLFKVPAHISRAELTSAGLAALAFAARAYDPSRGVPFARFASIRVRGALVDELRTGDWASRSVRARAPRQDGAVTARTATVGPPPTDAEVAQSLGVDPAELDADRRDVARALVLSLDGFADPEAVAGAANSTEPPPDEQILAAERLGYLHDAVALLPERLRLVVGRYFFEERPMADIAAELGVTESRVSQLRAEALTLLRGSLQMALGDSQPEPTEGRAAARKEAYYAAVAAHRTYRARLDTKPVELRAVSA
jgi:RNA polymerase sigma factor for flagellar operon FliA